jgi:WS/DGAT/MGAT family acyltransferase
MALLRAGSPAIVGNALKVLLVERRLDGVELGLESLRERVAAGLGSEPRLRQRLRATPLRLAPPAWVPDPSFSLARHVRSRELRSAGTEGLRKSVAALMSERLDPAHPLWAIDLLGPLPDGKAAVVCRLHHVLADGLVSIRIMSNLLWDEPPSAPAAEGAPEPRPATLLADGLRYRSERLGEALASPVARRDEWRDRVRRLTLLGRVLWRELGSSPASATALDARIGERREVAWALVSLGAARRAGGPGATVNDVLLAVIGGGLRAWLRPGGAGLRAKVPVSMHQAGEDTRMGNRDSFFFVDLAASEHDPSARLERISAQTRVRKRTDAETLHRFLGDLRALGPLSRPVERLVADPHAFTVEISNLRGPPGQITVAGYPVRELLTFAEPAQRHALRIAAISLGDRIAIGLCSDPEVTPPLAGLATAIERELERLG